MPDKMLKSKSSMIAFTLAGLSLLVICLIAIWLVISGGGRKSGIGEVELGSPSSDNFTQNAPNSDLPTTSATIASNNTTTLNPVPSVIIPSQENLPTIKTTTTMSSSVQETLPSEATTEIVLPSTAKPLYEVTLPTRAQHVPFCEFPADFKSLCPQIRQSTTNDKSNTSLQHSLDVRNTPNAFVKLSSLIRPVEYALNVSIVDKTQHLMAGSLDLLLEVLKEGHSIALHAGRNIRFIEQNQISIWLCNEEETLCPASITRLMDKQLLVIGLAKALQPRTVIRLKIGKFETEIASNPGLTSQIPSKWEKDRAWIVSSYNLQNGSRLVYPGVDEEEVMAALKLCIQHPKDTFARSNMPKRSVAEENSWTSTCFHESPSMSTKHFAFLLFDNLKQLVTGAGPSVEIFVGRHLQPENCQWIMDETVKALQKMASMTSMAYPLEKLSIVSSPLATDATHSYGLIQIKETMFEYPKYFEPHSLLTSQVVQQWISNIITICDKCIQDGLATYLEWIITSEFVIDGQSSNISKRFEDARNRLLHSENTGIKAGPSLLSVSSLNPTNSNQCADRTAVVVSRPQAFSTKTIAGHLQMYMLEKVYGRNVICDFLALAFKRFSWTGCVSTSVLSNLFSEASKSTEAKQVFDSFFLNSATVHHYPLVHIHLHQSNSSLVISQQQLSTGQPNTSNDFNQLYAVPLEVVDDSKKRTSLVLNVSRLVSHRPAAYVLVEPDNLARHIYNAENYDKLIECMGIDSSRCSAVSQSAMTSTFSDLCWAFLNNELQYQPHQVSQWRNIFDKLTAQNVSIVHGDCSCCMRHKKSSKAECRWTWQDKCSRINLLNDMQK